MTLTGLNIDISGDPSEMLCTQEEAISWFSSLKGEYENSVSKLGNCSLNIAFLTKVKIQEMNKMFAGNDKPTNVLIIEEALSQSKNTQHHLIHIFVHGVLHLLGFDHEEHSSAEQMESLEVRVLKKIGVADPY